MLRLAECCPSLTRDAGREERTHFFHDRSKNVVIDDILAIEPDAPREERNRPLPLDPSQRLTAERTQTFRIEKEPVWRSVKHASRVRNRVCRRVWGSKPSQRPGTYPGGTSTPIGRFG